MLKLKELLSKINHTIVIYVMMLVMFVMALLGLLAIPAVTATTVAFAANLVFVMSLAAASSVYLLKRFNMLLRTIDAKLEESEIISANEQVGVTIAISFLLWLGASLLCAAVPFIPYLLLLNLLTIVKVLFFTFVGCEALFGAAFLATTLTLSGVRYA